MNERRAAFSDIPLKDQIADIEKLIEKLGIRARQLESLKEKTGLGYRFMASFAELVKLSRNLVSGREAYRGAARLSEAERATRAERQRERYGREYRAGLHEQIKTMRSNLDHLEQLKTPYTAYKGFVEKIENEMASTCLSCSSASGEQKAESLKSSFRVAPARVITPIESRLKLSLKADMLREIVPPEYRLKDPILAGETASALKAALNKTAAPPAPPISLAGHFKRDRLRSPAINSLLRLKSGC